jgi:hypothetical protein
MEGDRRAVYADDGDEFEGIGAEASFHADQHGQSGVDVPELRTMEGGRRAKSAGDGDEFEGVGAGVSRYADQYEQFYLDMEIPRSE